MIESDAGCVFGWLRRCRQRLPRAAALLRGGSCAAGRARVSIAVRDKKKIAKKKHAHLATHTSTERDPDMEGAAVTVDALKAQILFCMELF